MSNETPRPPAGANPGTWAALTRPTFALLAVLLALLAAFLLAACGGDGQEPAAPTEGPPTATATATPPPRATPAPTPEISNGRFEFPEHGYAATVPQDWTPAFSILTGPGVVSDAFFGAEEDGLQPNISVTCETLTESITLDAFVEERLEVLRVLSTAPPEVSPTAVAGVEGKRVDYSRAGNENIAPIDKTDIFFINDRCAWTISLVTGEGDRDTYEPVLEDFLASFEFLP